MTDALKKGCPGVRPIAKKWRFCTFFPVNRGLGDRFFNTIPTTFRAMIHLPTEYIFFYITVLGFYPALA
jgi:hypothetical protein